MVPFFFLSTIILTIPLVKCICGGFRDEEGDECSSVLQQQAKQVAENQQNLAASSNPFLDVPNAATAIEYKKGYVMRKSCIDPNGKKSEYSFSNIKEDEYKLG